MKLMWFAQPCSVLEAVLKGCIYISKGEILYKLAHKNLDVTCSLRRNSSSGLGVPAGVSPAPGGFGTTGASAETAYQKGVRCQLKWQPFAG